jgi:hypothetical protein
MDVTRKVSFSNTDEYFGHTPSPQAAFPETAGFLAQNNKQC